jgi:hypothetical protein
VIARLRTELADYAGLELLRSRGVTGLALHTAAAIHPFGHPVVNRFTPVDNLPEPRTPSRLRAHDVATVALQALQP